MNRRHRSNQPNRSTAAPSGNRLSEVLLDGWRPLQRFDVAGFAVLRSRGLTKRANSAVAFDVAEGALADAVARVEELCAMTGDAACFRVFSDSPSGLDELLAERGYRSTGASSVLSRSIDAKGPAPASSSVIRVGPLDDEWFAAAWALGPYDGDDTRETLRDILAGTPAVQVELRGDDDETLAVGRAALTTSGREQLAVLNVIRVHPDHRRRGLGRAVSETLFAVAAAQGVTRAVLEVERDNAPAAALYRGLGFTPLTDYHYRVAALR